MPTRTRFAPVVKRRLALLLALPLAVCSCTNGAAPDDPNQRLTDIYSAAIPAVVTYEQPDLTGHASVDVVVFVAAREGVNIPFEVQIGVVNELDDWATIRFIDDFDEALIGEDDERVVREGGVLVQLGAVSDGTTLVELHADRYEGVDHLLTFELSLLRRAGQWSVDEPVTATAVTLTG
jgi:hypothetical protein